MNSLWTEKYRPKTLDELEAPSHIKTFLSNCINSGFPHLLLYGPPGTGKTTFAMLLKPTFILNASDDRGIDIIRNRVKKIANTASKQIILLDECENLTRDSQTCLRRILEDYPNTTFIFCTNYINKIIAPLKSRLLKIKFVAKKHSTLDRIGKAEAMDCDEVFFNDLFKKCKGDLRRCINVMQGIKPLKEPNVDELIGIIPDEILEKFWTENSKKFVDDFVFNSYSALIFIQQLNESIKGTEIQKAKFAKVLSELEGMSMRGCSDELLIMNLCAKKDDIYGNIRTF